MNRTQFLLLKLGEEGAEVSQMASKTIQFGMAETRENCPHNNCERLYAELDDINAAVEMLNELGGVFNYKPNRAAIAAKKTKVEHYLKYSQQLGMVEA